MFDKQAISQLESKLKELQSEIMSNQRLIDSLKRSETKFRLLFEKSPLPYQSLDREGKIIEVNPKWLDLFGYDRQEVIGTFFVNYLHEDEIDNFKHNFDTLKDVGSISSAEFQMVKKDGSSVFVSLNGLIGTDSAGTFQQTYCLLHDVTESKRIENIRIKSHEIWTRTFDTIDDIITIQDKNLTIIRANKAAHTLFNAKEGELTGKYCYEIFTGKSDPCPNCPLINSLQTGKGHSAIIEHDTLNRVFRVSSSLIAVRDGGEEFLVHVARDITKEMAAEKSLQESNERFFKAFEANPAPMVISEIDSGLFINVNRRSVEMLGHRREELIGKTFKTAGIWQDPLERDKAVAKLSTEDSFDNHPIHIKTKDGDIRLALWSAEKISIHGQELMLSILNDVTEQKEAEKKLRESEEKFALAFTSSPDSININRLEDGLYVEVNSGFTELTGFTRDDVQGKTSHDINIWHDFADRKKLVEDLNRQGFCENFKANFRRKDGSLTTALISARVISLNSIPHIISITRDISKIKRIEKEIFEQKLLFETMFNALDDGVVITDTNREILLANKGMNKTFGYLSEELTGRTTELLYAHPKNYQMDGNSVFNHDAQLKDRIYVSAYKHKSGREFPGETFGAKLYDQNNRWIGNLEIIRDISKRKKAEAERDRLIAAIKQTKDIILITDRKATIQYVNPAFEASSGYSFAEVKGRNPRILKSGQQNEQFYQDFWRTLRSGRTFTGRMVNRRKDGSFYTEEATISPIYDRDGQVVSYVAVKRDITEQILLEAQLQQAQKMEAVGRLTGGVAHDFNNTLAVIIGYTELALEDIEAEEPLHDDLEKILDAAQRSKDIVRQLLAFSRKQSIAPRVLNLNNAVDDILKILRHLIGEDINLSWIPEPKLSSVKMDPIQIDQILANLCVNAKDAIAGFGKITIETSMVTLTEKYCARHFGFYPGKFVRLSVSDNGSGIDRETQKHIFEPFFSTKELGRGTGLGLSTVYGIVKQNNGFINIYSEIDRGTTFNIYIPPCNDEILQGAENNMTKSNGGRGETVLLVEDEPVLLEMTYKMLEMLGYKVLKANGPKKALRIAEEYDDTIDLLFTDVVMPEMTGKELAELLQMLRPQLKVLFMSGYTANIISNNGILDEGIQFIQKPYSIGDLAAKLRDSLSPKDSY